MKISKDVKILITVIIGIITILFIWIYINLYKFDIQKTTVINQTEKKRYYVTLGKGEKLKNYHYNGTLPVKIIGERQTNLIFGNNSRDFCGHQKTDKHKLELVAISKKDTFYLPYPYYRELPDYPFSIIDSSWDLEINNIITVYKRDTITAFPESRVLYSNFNPKDSISVYENVYGGYRFFQK